MRVWQQPRPLSFDLSDRSTPRKASESEPGTTTQREPILRERRLFGGAYQLVAEVASGGMATVFLAIRHGEQGFEKCCAVKRIHPHLAQDEQFSNMFVDEARITAKLSHPYVCNVFDFGVAENGAYYIAMEFLRGETLHRVFSALGKRGSREEFPRVPLVAARVIANLAEGLHAAHTTKDERGQPLEIVHRDVTPQNLFVLYDGTVRVSDFGIARARQRLHHTHDDKLKGKLPYMAPELLERGDADHRVDVWALGVILWEFLTGHFLFWRGSEAETVASVGSRAIPAPSSLNSHVGKELDRIVLRALARVPEERYPTARELSRDLERFLSSAGDSMPNMDVAEFLSDVFPNGAERFDALLEVARDIVRKSTRPPPPPPPPSSPEDEDDPTRVYTRASDHERTMVSVQPSWHASSRAEQLEIIEAMPARAPLASRGWRVAAGVLGAAGVALAVGLALRGRGEVAASVPTGEVLVTTSGAAVTVIHEGRAFGRTPARLRLPAGRRELTLRSDRGLERTVLVDVTPAGVALVDESIIEVAP